MGKKKEDSDEISYQVQKCTWYYQMRKLHCELERQEWWMHACTVRKEKKPEARDQRWADREGQGEDKHSIRPHLTHMVILLMESGTSLLSDPCPESKHLTRG